MTTKTIYLLIGPKGSGKSFIGTLMEKHFGIKFIRVEDWAKEVKKHRQIDDPDYLRDVFQTIERGVRQALKQHDKIVFESTGLTVWFDQMIENLKQEYSVFTIGIQANDELCLSRVKFRDSSIHINVSDDQVNSINAHVREKKLRTDVILLNENKSEEEIALELESIFGKFRRHE